MEDLSIEVKFELETREECEDCVEDMMNDPYWSTQGPFEIVSI